MPASLCTVSVPAPVPVAAPRHTSLRPLLSPLLFPLLSPPLLPVPLPLLPSVLVPGLPAMLLPLLCLGLGLRL